MSSARPTRATEPGLRAGDPRKGSTMTFIQIIDVRTDKIEELRELDRQWEAATEGRRTLRRSIVAADRNDPARRVQIVFFDSYEDAMTNSKLPETQAAAATYAELVDGPPVFHDLDVIEDRTL